MSLILHVDNFWVAVYVRAHQRRVRIAFHKRLHLDMRVLFGPRDEVLSDVVSRAPGRA